MSERETSATALVESSRRLKELQRWHLTSGRKINERAMIDYMNSLIPKK